MPQEKITKSSPRLKRSSIRRSTDADIKAIHAWLVEEEAGGIAGNFLCNWRLTLECHKEGRLLVYVDSEDGGPVAYQWGDLNYPGILQVRNDMRRKGIGKKIVRRRIAEALKRNEGILRIECKPSTSIPFWQAMGFKLLEKTNGKNYAYRILDKKFDFPSHGEYVHVVIRFYPENRKWDDLISPYFTAEPTAMFIDDGIIQLSERVYFFGDVYAHKHDVVIEVIINGRRHFLDKAKYDESRKMGVLRCSNGFYLDQILVNNPGHP